METRLPEDQRLVSLADAGQYLSVSRPTLLRWIRTGLLPSVVLNGHRRVRVIDLEAVAQRGLGEPRRPRGASRQGRQAGAPPDAGLEGDRS